MYKMENCFELALGLNLYPLKVEVLISDKENDFCDIFVLIIQIIANFNRFYQEKFFRSAKNYFTVVAKSFFCTNIV